MGGAWVTFGYLLKFTHALPTRCAQSQNPALSLRKNNNLCSLLQAHVALVFVSRKKKIFFILRKSDRAFCVSDILHPSTVVHCARVPSCILKSLMQTSDHFL